MLGLVLDHMSLPPYVTDGIVSSVVRNRGVEVRATLRPPLLLLVSLCSADPEVLVTKGAMLPVRDLMSHWIGNSDLPAVTLSPSCLCRTAGNRERECAHQVIRTCQGEIGRLCSQGRQQSVSPGSVTNVNRKPQQPKTRQDC